MGIDDTDLEEILALLPQENIPSDPALVRHAIEQFVDLVELLMRPLQLPPAGSSSFKQPSSDHRVSNEFAAWLAAIGAEARFL